jgi:iron complex transport system ATP-binding protein
MAVLEVLRSLADDGLGILAITHHLNAAAQYADRVLLLDRGEVAAMGRPGDVLTETTIRRVFDWPVVIQHLEDGSPHIVPLRRTSES